VSDFAARAARDTDITLETMRSDAGNEIERDCRLAWTKFYWALIDPSPNPDPRRAAREAEFLDSLQAEVPVPLEELEVIWIPDAGGRMLACAFPTHALEQIICSVRDRRAGSAFAANELFTLGPAGLPPLLRDAAPEVEVSGINFLVGRFTPASVRNLGNQIRRWALFYAIVAVVLVGAGARLLALAANYSSESLQTETRTVLRDTGFNGNDIPSAGRALADATSIVRRARGGEAAAVVPGDAAASLAGLLRHWPNDVESRTSHLSVTARAVTLSVQVADESQARAIGTALSECEGWTLEPPHTQRAATGLQFFATLKKSNAPEGGR